MFTQLEKSIPKLRKNTSKTPPKILQKPVQNTFKNAIEKNTIFCMIFFIIWNAQNMKIVALVEAKRYILQNRRVRKKYENYLPKHPENPSKID